MTLIDFESDPVDLVDQPAGTGKGHSKFPNDLLDLDFTKSSADLQMEQVQGLKDSGIAQDDLNIEYEGFAEETEVVKQQIDDFSSGSSAPDDVVVDEVDSEVGLVEPINSLPTEPTFAAEFVSVATAVIAQRHAGLGACAGDA